MGLIEGMGFRVQGLGSSLKGNGTWHTDWSDCGNAQTTPMHNVRGRVKQ